MGALIQKLQKALDLDHSKHTLSDVADQIERGDAKLWARGQSVVVTQVVEYPQKRTLNVWLAAGNLDEITELMPEIYEYGRQWGCEFAETVCRKGWARTMAAVGWERADKVVVMTRNLNKDG